MASFPLREQGQLQTQPGFAISQQYWEYLIASPKSLFQVIKNASKLSDFSLHISEEFNDKILRPELSDAEKLMLHEEVKKIYETYCLDESIDKIRFDPFIVEEIRNSKLLGCCFRVIVKSRHSTDLILSIQSCLTDKR